MNERQAAQRKLGELAFAMQELALFLDTHPECEKAISLLNSYRSMYAELSENYRKKYGDLIITHNDSTDDKRWKWIDGPWPWEKSAGEE